MLIIAHLNTSEERAPYLVLMYLVCVCVVKPECTFVDVEGV